MAKKIKGAAKKRVRRGVVEGRAYIQSTFNNTIVTIFINRRGRTFKKLF